MKGEWSDDEGTTGGAAGGGAGFDLGDWSGDGDGGGEGWGERGGAWEAVARGGGGGGDGLAGKLGGQAEVLMADLADREAGDRLVEAAWGLWGGLDAWLHLAGADTLTGAGAKLTFDEKLDLLLAVDVVSTMRLCRAVGRRMCEARSGVIVTMGWDQAETGMEGDSGELFAASKAAVMGFTRSLAVSLAPYVRVNAVAPGWIRTAWGESGT